MITPPRERNSHAAADEHHHCVLGPGVRRKKLGVPGERDAGVVDHALLQWRRDHRVERPFAAAVGGDLQGAQHVAAVGRIEPSRDRRLRKRHVEHRERASTGGRAHFGRMIRHFERHAQQARAPLEQLAVGDHDDARRQPAAREPDAQVGPDAGWLARRYRNERSVEC